MISIGTVLTLGIVAAVVAGGYAVYRNADKLGGALSRGVETNLSVPLGNYFDNLWSGLNNNLQTTTGGPVQQAQQKAAGTDPTPGIVNPLPTATAQTPTGDAAVTPAYATELTNRLLPKAQESADLVLSLWSESSRQKLIQQAAEFAKGSPTRELTTAQNIVDLTRVSVGGSEPLTNKFYSLFTLANKPWGEPGQVLPLSKEAISYYSKIGVVPREVYL